jgi:adenosine deaminase
MIGGYVRQGFDTEPTTTTTARGGDVALVTGIRDLRRLPKAELHLHLTGAMRPETLRELAREQGFEPPDPRVRDWAGFLEVWHAARVVSGAGPGNLDRLVRETVADAASDGVVWLQPHFSPHLHGGPETWDAVLELVLAAGLDEAGRQGIGFGLTMALPRHKGPELAGELSDWPSDTRTAACSRSDSAATRRRSRPCRSHPRSPSPATPG